MYARSTTLIARPGSLDGGIAYFRDEVMPALRGIDGFVGASLIADRDSGLCIVTASWDSAESLAATAERVTALRERAASVFGTDSTEVEEWEVAVMHRDHRAGDAACVRATWSKVDPAEADRAIDLWKHGALPAIEQLPGFCSASLLVNRETGRGVTTVAFDSRDALEGSRAAAETIRARAARETGAEVLSVRELELVHAHLDIPEMV